MKSPKSFGKQKKRRLFIIRRVTGDSMLPTLTAGHIIIGVTRFKAVRIGDVVVIRHQGLEKIKRIQQVRDGQVYLVGDNPTHSTDSRSFGWLSVSVVCARVVWPR